MGRLLVVDDEPGVRDFLAEALTSAGHDVSEARDGADALTKVLAQSFDLMITDLRMPGPIDGLALVRRAKSEQPDMEVIVLTAHGTVETAVEAMKLGAFDYLEKPVSGPAGLRLIVARALERRQLIAKDQVRRETSRLPPLSYGDPIMEAAIRALARVARTSSTVLLLGESGTGKEVAARTIHDQSDRADGPFVPINCAAISESLMESEIFGHEKGAFTGAAAARRGRLELAHGGTLFLDEIGELKPELQAKLLRVLQERRFERVGGVRTIEVDVRWIAATNRDLAELMRQGLFREDLYHRLAVFPVRLPPLRDRRQDLLPLAESLLAGIATALGRPALRLDRSAREQILGSRWPGNVRELANALERAAILADGNELRGDDLQPPGGSTGPASTEPRTIAELERDAIRLALEESHGNRRRAAERLGIGERTLYEKLKRYGIAR